MVVDPELLALCHYTLMLLSLVSMLQSPEISATFPQAM